MRLWSLRQPTPTACIDARANVCSVQWSPRDPHLLAFGSANYRAFVYDRRQVSSTRFISPMPPWCVSQRLQVQHAGEQMHVMLVLVRLH